MKDCSCPVTCPLSEVRAVNAAVFLCACLWGQPNRERNTFAVSKQLFKLLIIVVVIKRGKKKRGEKELETSPPEVQGLIIQRMLPIPFSPSLTFSSRQSSFNCAVECNSKEEGGNYSLY